MAASVLKFTFVVIGETRDDVLHELDEVCNKVILEQGGEPWVIILDDLKMQATNEQALLSSAPGGSFYYGERTLLFTGPTKLGDGTGFHDGFRPQVEDEPDYH